MSWHSEHSASSSESVDTKQCESHESTVVSPASVVDDNHQLYDVLHDHLARALVPPTSEDEYDPQTTQGLVSVTWHAGEPMPKLEPWDKQTGATLDSIVAAYDQQGTTLGTQLGQQENSELAYERASEINLVATIVKGVHQHAAKSDLGELREDIKDQLTALGPRYPYNASKVPSSVWRSENRKLGSTRRGGPLTKAKVNFMLENLRLREEAEQSATSTMA